MKILGPYLHRVPLVLSQGDSALSLANGCVSSWEKNEKGP